MYRGKRTHNHHHHNNYKYNAINRNNNANNSLKFPEFTMPNKSYSNKFQYIRIIPSGKRGYLWIKQQGAQINIYFVTSHYNGKINMEKINKNTLMMNTTSLGCGKYGTIIYGTLFKYKSKVEIFAMETLVMCHNDNMLHHYTFDSNIKKLSHLYYNYCYDYVKVDDNERKRESNIHLVLCNTFENAIKKVDTITDNNSNDDFYKNLQTEISETPYSIYCIELHDNSGKTYEIKNPKSLGLRETHQNRMFYVRAGIPEDCYYLYNDNTYSNLIDLALIPSYKSSIMMNKIFRNIRENENLDLLEESDDEEEFENVDEDKYVDTEMCVKMECKYCVIRKKWIPFKLYE